MENELKEISQSNENRTDNALSDNREVLKELSLNKSEQLNVTLDKATTNIEKSNNTIITVADPFGFEKMSEFENYDPQTSLLVNISTCTNTEDPLELNFEEQTVDSLTDLSVNPYMVGNVSKETAGSGNETINVDSNQYSNMSYEPMDVDETFDECVVLQDSKSVVTVDNTTMSFKDANETIEKEPFPIYEVVTDSKHFPTSPNSPNKPYSFPTSPKSYKPSASFSTKKFENQLKSPMSSAHLKDDEVSDPKLNESKKFPLLNITIDEKQQINSDVGNVEQEELVIKQLENETPINEEQQHDVEKESEIQKESVITPLEVENKESMIEENSQVLETQQHDFEKGSEMHKESVIKESMIEGNSQVLETQKRDVEKDSGMHKELLNSPLVLENKGSMIEENSQVLETQNHETTPLAEETDKILNSEEHFEECMDSFELEEKKSLIDGDENEKSLVVDDEKILNTENFNTGEVEIEEKINVEKEDNQQILNIEKAVVDKDFDNQLSISKESLEFKVDNVKDFEEYSQENENPIIEIVNMENTNVEKNSEVFELENKSDLGEEENQNQPEEIKILNYPMMDLEKTMSLNDLSVKSSCENLSVEKLEFKTPCGEKVALNTTMNLRTEENEAAVDGAQNMSFTSENRVEEKETEFKVPFTPAFVDFGSSGDHPPNDKNQQVGDFKMPAQQHGAFGDSDFKGNFILDPADFDFLLTKGNSNVQIDRNSLLLRFDPLLGAVVPVNANKQQRLDEILNATKQHIRNTLTHTGEESAREKLINTTTTTIREECQIQGSSSQTPNVATQQIMSANATIESDTAILSQSSNNFDKERNVLNSNMDDIGTKIKNEVLKTEDVERKLKEAEQREESLIKRITEKDKLINKQNGVIEAYERAIAEFVSEKEHLVQKYEKQLVEVKADRDANFRHLSSLETTFSDLHVKFEKSKAMTQQLQASQELLIEERKKALDNLRQQEQRYLKMKNHAMEQLEIANKKLESLTREHQMEMTRLKALLKKEEITRASINEQLAQKTKENGELMKICDELINGGSS